VGLLHQIARVGQREGDYARLCLQRVVKRLSVQRLRNVVDRKGPARQPLHHIDDQGGGKRRSGVTSSQDFRRRSKKLLNRNIPASIPGIQTGRGAIGSGCMSNSAALKANATPSPKQITALINLTVRILAFSNSNGFLKNIEETRQYIRVTLSVWTSRRRRRANSTTRMLELYPDRVNPGSLWGSVNAAKAS
jgi:hypothetical protein